MNPPDSNLCRIRAALLMLPLAVVACAATLLSGCSDGQWLPSEQQEASASALINISGVAALLDDEGNPMPSSPENIPTDAAAQTRAGRYASTTQVEQLELAYGENLVRLELVGPDAGAVEQAMQRAARAQAETQVDATTPVLVYAMGHLRAAAVVANRLSDDGHSRVWVVTN